jgi:hypothetical protein
MQVAKNAERKMVEKKEMDVEREKLRVLEDEEKRRLERIRKEKLKELNQMGVPDKYQTDLMFKKVE